MLPAASYRASSASFGEFPLKKRLKVVPLLLILLAGFAVLGVDVCAEKTLPRNYDLTAAVKLSRILDRQLMFSFVTSDCPHCQTFKEDVLSNPAVKNVLHEHFVFSLISLDKLSKFTLPEKGEISNYQFASGLGVGGTPSTFFFFPSDPGLSHRGIIGLPGVLECKYLNYYSDTAKELLKLTEFCKEGSEGEYEAEVGIMIWALNHIGRLSPKDVSEAADSTTEKSKSTFYHFRNKIKEISVEDLHFLESKSVDIPVLSSGFDKALLENAKEVVLNFSDVSSAKDLAEGILSETSVGKVFVVNGQDDS